MPISAPDKIITPWATSGLKATIPETADPLLGRAGFDQGFPAINMTPKTAGGIPPFGQDFNGIFFDVTQALQFMQAGGTFPYDGAWATAVGGYPAGALVSRTDNQGLWRNTVANNLTDPEAGGAGWQPEGSGATAVTMTSSNVTLTPLQAAREMIVITGTLTTNLQLTFPGYVKQWLVVNNTTGAFSITCKTASGTGVAAEQSSATLIYGDGVNIAASADTGFDYLNTLRIDIAASTTIDLSVGAPNTRNINITGSGVSVGAFTVTAGQLYFVRFGGAGTLVNSSSIITNRGANISTAAGDTCIIRATAANVVEVLCGDFLSERAIGTGQTWQTLTGSRATNTNYTNTTGRSIVVVVVGATGSYVATMTINGIPVGQFVPITSGTLTSTVTTIVPPGGVYQMTTLGTLQSWQELR
jgi:hypothetical protein